MIRYYIEIENNIITQLTKIEGKNVEEIEIVEPFLEVTEEFYLQYKDLLPATFELDEGGNIISITPIPRPEPEPIVPEPTTEEMLLEAYLKINELENRLQILESGK